MPRIGRNQFRKLQRKYKTDAAIANLYKISRQAVFKIRKKYDIPPVEYKKSTRDIAIKRLYKEGVSISKIAQRASLSRMQVYRIVKKGE